MWKFSKSMLLKLKMNYRNFDWLNFCRRTSNKIYSSITKHISKNKNEKVIGNGAGGDKTLLIDKIAEDIILSELNQLKKTFGFSVITEESGALEFGSEFPKILIDPIDGSFNAKKNATLPFSTSIAIAEDDSLKSIFFGYIFEILGKNEFFAQKGRGSFYNNRRIDLKKSQKNKKSEEIEVICVDMIDEFSELNKIIKNTKIKPKIRIIGSMALSMCYTAMGVFDLYVHLRGGRIIDFASSKLFAEEAGGIVSDLENKLPSALITNNLKEKFKIITAREKKHLYVFK